MYRRRMTISNLENILNHKHDIIESGYEVCGVVEKLGSGAETFFKVGNEVVGKIIMLQHFTGCRNMSFRYEMWRMCSIHSSGLRQFW